MAKKAKTKAVSRQSHEKRKRFAAEYLIDLNATQAAIRAGYSAKTAHSQGPRLLEDVEVQRWISEGMRARAERTEVTVARVLEELSYVGFSNIREAISVNDEGDVTIRRLDELEPRVCRAIESITQTVTESVGRDGDRRMEKTKTTLKMHSKVTGLRMLMDHLGMDAPKKVDATLNDHEARSALAAKLEELSAKR